MQHPSSADGGATLHLLCGKIGAGKSTLSQQLAANPRHVLISEDAWLATLHPGEIHPSPIICSAQPRCAAC